MSLLERVSLLDLVSLLERVSLVNLVNLLDLVTLLGLVGLLDLVTLLDLVSPLEQVGLLFGLQLVLPSVRYRHADDPTDVWPAGSPAAVAGAVVAIGVADSGTRCRYVHIPLT